MVGPGGSPVCVPPTRYVRPCSRFPPQAAVGPYPSPAVPPYTPPPSCPPGPDPLCAPLHRRHPLCFPCPPLVSTLSVCSTVSRCRPVPCPCPPGAAARPAGIARGWSAVRSLLGSWCGGLGAPAAPGRIPVRAARVKWDTGGTRSHSCCVGWALAAAPGQLSFSQRSGIERLWLKAGVS